MKLNLHFNITQKLTLLLVGLAAALLAAVGALSVYNGYVALRAAAVSELLATAIEKQAALDVWISERQADLAALAATPRVLDDLASRSVAPASPGKPAAAAGLGQAVHDHLAADLQNWTGANQAFLALTVIEPEHGQVIASTDPGEEGKFREDRAYFIAGKAGPTVQNPQYTVQGLTMFVAAPLRSADGRLLGVLAGRVNLAEMDAIIARRTGLRQTADVYLVNASNLLVTQPRFVADPVVLQRGIHSEAANRCLARNSGVISADDYRGVPAISVYRWLPKTELCLIAEIDQAEATAPSRAFGMTILLIAGLALLAISALAVVMARGITRPVHQLVRGTQEIGRGNLDYRIAVRTRDELGQLANAFNEMAVNLRMSLGETARGQRLLAALNQAAQAVQHARTPEEVYRIVGEEVARLGYHAAVLTLTDDGTHLSVPYLNFDPALQRTAEKLVGVTAADFRLLLTPGGFYQRILAEGETVFLGSFIEPVAEAVPWLLRPLIGRVIRLLGIKQGIIAPLRISGEVRSLLMVTGDGLNADDVLAVKTFANQTAIALENARLYQETRAWAAELEQRVQAQTETVRATEARLRTVVTNAPIVLWASDREGKFTLSEGKGLEMLGLKSGEVVGQSVFEVYRDVPPIPAAIRRALSGESFTATVEVAGLVFDTHYSPMRDASGQVIGVTGVSIDITERKRTEDALARSHSLLEATLESTADGLLIVDNQGQITRFNRKFAELWRIPQDILDTRDDGKALAYAQKQLKDPDNFFSKVQELYSRPADDSFDMLEFQDGRVFERYSGPQRIGAQIIGRVWSFRDVTARKQAEAALEAERELLRTLMDNIPDAIYFKDAESRFVRNSQAGARQFGLSDPAQMSGKTDFDFFTEEHARAAYEDEQAIVRSGQPLVGKEEKETWPDGRVTWVSTTKMPLHDQAGRIVGTFGISRDITERKQVEEALRESEERFRAVFERSTIGKSLTAPDGSLLKINRAFADMLGYTIEELQRADFAQITHPDDVAESRECLRCLLANERSDYRMETRYFHKKGNIVWADISTALLRDSNGAALYFFTSIQDITHRKQAEQALAQKTQELERSNAELEHFAYVASHDLQEPLRMVSSFMGLLAQRYQGQLDADADEFIGFAIDGAHRMQRLIDGLLDYSRVGTRSEPFAPTDAAAAVDDALWNLELAIQDTGAIVTRDPLPTVMADRDQLMQVFQNLIGNAIKFRGAEPPRVHISARQTFEVSSQAWEFSVRDNGIGIAPEHLGRIFGIFQRLHSQAEYPGTGIGLATCKKIIERHGGRIWVESAPGQGTTFYFTLG